MVQVNFPTFGQEAAGNPGEVQWNEDGLLAATNKYFWSQSTNRLWIGSTSLTGDPNGKLELETEASLSALVIKGAPSQTEPLQKWVNNSNTLLGSILNDGSWRPPFLTNTSAQNNSVYISQDNNRLVYKNSAGTVVSLEPVSFTLRP